MFDLGEVANRVSSTFQALPSFKAPTPMAQFSSGGYGSPLPGPTPSFGGIPGGNSFGGFSLGPLNFGTGFLGPIQFGGISSPSSNVQLNTDGTNFVPPVTTPGKATSANQGSNLVSGPNAKVLGWKDQINAASVEFGVPADVISAVMDFESGGEHYSPSGSVKSSPAGALGLMQLMPKTAQGLGVNPFRPEENIRGGAKYLKQLYDTYGDWDKALVAYNAGHYDPSASYNGFTAGQYMQHVQALRSQYATSPLQTGQINVKGQDLSPNQFTHPGELLTPDEAAAACGPTAAVALMKSFGRPLTLREAVDAAKQVGWTPQGMGGIFNESKLLDHYGINHDVIGDIKGDLDEGRMQGDVGAGKPVVVSGPEHYMTITDYDPVLGYYAGTSGAVSNQRSAWLTYSQLKAAAGGSFNGAIYLK